MSTLPDSLRTLLAETVDYAGLFPPSQVPMAVAVQNFAEYLKSKHSWMLGRFIVPAANLDKFYKEAEKHFDGKNIWRLSAIIGEDSKRELGKVKRFNDKNVGKAIIDTVEVKVFSPENIKNVLQFLPPDVVVYFEIPSSIILTDLITAIAITKTRAKIRTGGITPDAFPPVDEIVKFLRVCVAANVPFKATAGLHHPLRCVKPLTYEEGAPKGVMNGFLNLFLTSAFLRQNLNHTFVHDLMHDVDEKNFRFEDQGIFWKENFVSLKEIEIARQKCAISFGSCSFDEPVEDLRQLSVIS